MKKRIAFALALIVCLTISLTSCSGGASGVTAGLGSVVTLADKSADGNLKSQVDALFCSASFDKDGKIISVSFDTAQVVSDFAGGALANVGEAKTKNELGKDYGMKSNSGIGKEWNEQVDELEAYMVGKTVDEVKQMKTKVKDENHQAVPDEAELTSKVTIDVGDFIKALEESWANKK